MRLDDLVAGISEFDMDGEHYYVERIDNGKVWSVRESDGAVVPFGGHLTIGEQTYERRGTIRRLVRNLRFAIP